MRRILAGMLTLGLLASLLACAAPAAGPESAPVPTPASAPEPAAHAGPPADEYERALWHGFVPEALVSADPDGTGVSWAEYCAMLGSVIAARDAALLPAWQETVKDAPDAAIKRDGAMIALLFAAKAMGWARFNAVQPAGFLDNLPWMLRNAAQSYPVFDWNTPVDLGDGCSDRNHIGPAYDFCLRRISQKSDRPLLEFDESYDLRLEQPLTLREAALSVLRLFESERLITDADGAKSSTIAPEALAAAARMPAVSPSDIPAWRGSSMAICDMYASHGHTMVWEEDIASFADMGFNYLRLMLLWPDFCFIDDGTLVFYAGVLENIDRIIEWCAGYGIHLCIDMHELPGYGFTDRSVLEDAHSRALARLVWEVFSARYADVPAALLSYNLVNEPDSSYFSDESYAAFAAELCAVIRAGDRAGKLIVSDGMLDGSGETGWGWADACPGRPNALLPADIMQTIHLYPWNAGARSGYLFLLDWPYEQGVAFNNYVGNGSRLMIKGNFPGGTKVTLHIDTVYDGGAPIVCSADGKEVASFPRSFRPGQDNFKYKGEGRTEFDIGSNNGYVVEFQMPQACSEISVGSDFCVTDILLRIPQADKNTHDYPVPDNAMENGFVYEKGRYASVFVRAVPAWSGRPSVLHVADDLSYTVENPAEAEVFDMESLRAYVARWAAWSEACGAPIMCNEFGVPLGLPEKARVGYMRAVLDLFDEYDIPWCLYTNEMSCWSPVVCDADVRAGRTILPADGSVTLRDGFWYDEPMLALLREYGA